ncbi:uncharacterized protein OCT59_028847 [Rhizophagus irregularis]|uniref:uncharacterized protein n=1 Tax=Rhizophagus irregularis TaxID=588596 RepID=UPI0019E27497|nr:hypothetical protein OCT59_028847 [Rhizophagus irregularis]GBC52497.2 hypothetical protein RIR_jg27364.t1 [Rhizophagus irregularis DAOM 181602=DAOM 197198]
MVDHFDQNFRTEKWYWRQNLLSKHTILQDIDIGLSKKVITFYLNILAHQVLQDEMERLSIECEELHSWLQQAREEVTRVKTDKEKIGSEGTNNKEE